MKATIFWAGILLFGVILWFSLRGSEETSRLSSQAPASESIASQPPDSSASSVSVKMEERPPAAARKNHTPDVKTDAPINQGEKRAPNPPAMKVLPLQDEKGQLVLMDQASAVRECAKRGMHLPTARELIEVVKSWGGKGLVDGTGERAARVIARNADGKVDDFYYYYSWDGFVLPTNELGKLEKHNIVSSSVDADPERPSDPPCVLSLGVVSGADGGLTLRCSGVYELKARQAAPDMVRDAHSAAFCLENIR